MTAKIWGGILLGVFVAAVGCELVRRRYPGLTKKVSDSTKDAIDITDKKIKEFTNAASGAFREGYESVKVKA